ncbi:MAG: Crp/Fnr family transcriptional regulator [Synechococcus sp.]
MSDNGDVRTLGIWGAGDIIGIPLSRNYPFQIECLTTTRVSLTPDNSILGGKWMVAHLQQTESLLAIQYQGLVKDRLLLFLQWLGDRFGQPTPDGTRIGIRLTHQEISEAINSTRVTVTRTLNALEQAGYLNWSRRMCVLLKPSR